MLISVPVYAFVFVNETQVTFKDFLVSALMNTLKAQAIPTRIL